jgi:hypothetical protein
MPTVLRAGPYRFFFYAGDGVSRPISMSSTMAVKRSSGSTRCGWIEVAAFAGKKSMTFAG